MDAPIVYPTIEIAGTTYTLRLSREALAFRLSDNNIDLTAIMKSFAVLVRTLHVMMEPRFPGTPEELAHLVYEPEIRAKAMAAVFEAIKKVFPPMTGQVTAGAEARPN